MTSSEIRRQYVDFFVQKHGHTFVPSSPVVPIDDPTLLFTNAGMNQFKPIFLGLEKRPYTRAVNTQKCIRAGGKHNDLDDVGRSRRHHTFFEMLGNWSFGDYFKRGAISMAWELLTGVWKLDPKRLHVSCFEGDEKNGVPRDTEAAQLWKEIAGLPDDHIHYFGKDNFWEMGETGPCGPCTEIYYDRTPNADGGQHVNGDDPRVMEIWNNVFIQYNRNPDRSLTVLPSQHVDTGMGFERLCQVLQNKDSNYSIDLWDPFWQKLTELSGKKYQGRFPRTNAADPEAESADEQLRYDIAFRVIADHVRCLTFALTDGADPSNEGRGYVLRRILRRAVRFGRQQLDLHEPFLHTLVPVVVDSMGEAFPELKKNPNRVIELIKDEETSFGRTLDRGIALFDDAAKAGRITADDAFKLHDTFGFPIDLTRIMAEERGLKVDEAGYEARMEEARAKARAGGKESAGAVYDLTPNALSELAAANIVPTDDSAKHGQASVNASVEAIWTGQQFVPSVDAASGVSAIILGRTNFYAEMGGQIGDSGEITTDDGLFKVQTTRVVGGYVLHIGSMVKGRIATRHAVITALSAGRQATEKNHTTTHLANWALREVLGDGVHQKGSLVDPDKLRFDFTHGKSFTEEELTRIETLVNAQIVEHRPVYCQEVPQEQAVKINGLRAVFGEKYPPKVRVVSIGAPVEELLADPDNPKWREFSVEFCGGTHLSDSSAAGQFIVIAEEAVAKGVRRIVALTGQPAKTVAEASQQLERQLSIARSAAESTLPEAIAGLQKALTGSPISLRVKRRAQALITELQAKFKAWEKANKASGAGDSHTLALATELLERAPGLGAGKLIVGEIPGASDDELRAAVDSLKKKSPGSAIMLASASEAKVTFLAVVADDLIARGLKAGDWAREAAKVTGGSGGGRPQLAQAGGKDPTKLAEALDKARAFAVSAVA